MSTSPEPPPRIVDNRHKKREPAPELVTDPEVAEAIAAQAKAASEEDAAEPALNVSTFIIVALDGGGVMSTYSRGSDLQVIMDKGIVTQREASPADLMNMSSQLQLSIQGNEFASRVMMALQQQAMAQAVSKLPPHQR